MDTFNLKKRLASSLEDYHPSGPVLHDNQYHGLSQLAVYPGYIGQFHDRLVAVPLSAVFDLPYDSQAFLLPSIAESLGLPLSALISYREYYTTTWHQSKRPRLSQDSTMAPSFNSSPVSSIQEKPYVLQQHVEGDDRHLSASTSCWSFAACVAGCCDPFLFCKAEPEHQPVPNTSYDSYTFTGPPQPLDTTITSNNQSPYHIAPIANHSGVFSPDGSAPITQYQHHHSTLQPTVVGAQPIMNRGDVILPSTTTEQISLGHSMQYLAPGLTQSGIEPVPHGYMNTDLMTFLPGLQGYTPPSASDLRDTDSPDNSPHEASAQPPRVPTARRKPFKDQEQREKTARTRKIGSCIRCRIQRIRCVENEEQGAPCQSCKKTATQKVFRMGCLRWKIMDVKLYKPGQVEGHEWTRRWKDGVVDDIGKWASDEIRTIQVAPEGYDGMWITLQVRQFAIIEGDATQRRYKHGAGRELTINIPPYAIVDLENAKASFDWYICNGLVTCCNALLGPPEGLLRRTYDLAIRMSTDEHIDQVERRLLQSTLTLWMSIRLTTRSFTIVGADTLEMEPTPLDARTPPKPQIPIPPVVGAQIDLVLIHQIQAQLRRKTLEELQKITCDRRPKTWLTQYLVTFILLHNVALIIKHDAGYAVKHGIQTRFARVEKVKEYDHGANTLLAYFHHTNKNVYPFSAQCRDDELRNLAKLDRSGVDLVKFTRHCVESQRNDWNDIRQLEHYEQGFFYVSQLFDEEWAPKLMPANVGNLTESQLAARPMAPGGASVGRKSFSLLSTRC